MIVEQNLNKHSRMSEQVGFVTYKQFATDVLQLLLDLFAVLLGESLFGGAIDFLLNRSDDTPRRPARADHILVGDGQ